MRADEMAVLPDNEERAKGYVNRGVWSSVYAKIGGVRPGFFLAGVCVRCGCAPAAAAVRWHAARLVLAPAPMCLAYVQTCTAALLAARP